MSSVGPSRPADLDRILLPFHTTPTPGPSTRTTASSSMTRVTIPSLLAASAGLTPRHDPPHRQDRQLRPYRHITEAEMEDLAKRREGMQLNAIQKELEKGVWRPGCDINGSYEARVSMLAWLGALDRGLGRGDAASALLETLGAPTEATPMKARQCWLVYCYIHKQALRGHRVDPTIRSADDLINRLENRASVWHNILIAARGKERNLLNVSRIDEIWGVGWFERVPAKMRGKGWIYPEDCSDKTLRRIVSAADNLGRSSFAAAVAAWETHFDQREKRAGKTDSLMPSDIKGPYGNASGEPEGGWDGPAPKRLRRSTRAMHPEVPSHSAELIDAWDREPSPAASSQDGTPETPDSRSITFHQSPAAERTMRCEMNQLTPNMRNIIDLLADALRSDEVLETCCPRCENKAERLAQALQVLVAAAIDALESEESHDFSYVDDSPAAE